MPFRFSAALPALAAVLLLAACGANDADTGSLSAKEQLKQPRASVKTAAADYATVVQQLYVAYFGRPADPGGLQSFEAQLAADSAPTNTAALALAYDSDPAIRTLIDGFGQSTESQNLYGSGTTEDFVKAIFSNVLGRQPAASGLNYWAGQIDSGSLSKGDAALAIMAGALQPNTAQGQIDEQLVNNRIAVATYYTSQVSQQNAAGAYVGSAAASSARNLLAQVSSSTDPSSLNGTVTTAIADLITAIVQSDGGSFCGTISGSFSGTVNLTLTSNGGSTFSASGTVNVDGQSIPISGTAQPPALNVELYCSTGACGTVSGTISPTTVSGTYSIPGLGSGQIALNRSC
jgi:hypothetical protein